MFLRNYARPLCPVSVQVVSSADKVELEKQLSDARRSLEISTKGRSWKNIELSGTEVARLQGLIRELPRAKPLGISFDHMLIIEAGLLILLQALLMAVSALNVIKLRQLAESTTPERAYNCFPQTEDENRMGAGFSNAFHHSASLRCE